MGTSVPQTDLRQQAIDAAYEALLASSTSWEPGQKLGQPLGRYLAEICVNASGSFIAAAARQETAQQIAAKIEAERDKIPSREESANDEYWGGIEDGLTWALRAFGAALAREREQITDLLRPERINESVPQTGE